MDHSSLMDKRVIVLQPKLAEHAGGGPAHGSPPPPPLSTFHNLCMLPATFFPLCFLPQIDAIFPRTRGYARPMLPIAWRWTSRRGAGEAHVIQILFFFYSFQAENSSYIFFLIPGISTVPVLVSSPPPLERCESAELEFVIMLPRCR